MNRINRITVLEELKKAAWDTVFAYSNNYAMTEPKEGMRGEWERAIAKAKIIEQMYNEMPVHVHFVDTDTMRRYNRKYIGSISSTSSAMTRTDDPHAYVSLIEFEIDRIHGGGYFDGDRRLFHIEHHLGINYILSGRYDIERHERYDEGKDSTVQITVDSFGTIQAIEWYDESE
jgi:hypothetical protein